MEACLEAEALLDVSTGMSAVSSRRSLDLAVKWLCENDEALKRPSHETLFDKLNSAPFKTTIDTDVMKACQYVRSLGNKAAHNPGDITYENAEKAIKCVYQLIHWIERLYPDAGTRHERHRICMRCGSLLWADSLTCPVCNNVCLSSGTEDPSLRSALLLVCSQRVNLLQDAGLLLAGIADACPQLHEDAVLMDALSESLEVDSDSVREHLAPRYPSDVVDEVEAALYFARRYVRNPMRFVHNPRDADSNWRLIVRKRGKLSAGQRGLKDKEREALKAERKRERDKTRLGLENARTTRTEAVTLMLGRGVHRNRQQAVRQLIDASEDGDALAAYDLGVCYYRGIGVKKNLARSEELFITASSHGCAEADYALGLQYRYLRKPEALGRFHVAANFGIVDAMNWLADYYFEKYQLQQRVSYKDEAQRFRAAVERIDPVSAKRAMGMRCLSGRRFVTRLTEDGYIYRRVNNPSAAAKSFQEAANMGDSASKYALGVCCLKGIGVRANANVAVRLFFEAARMGYAPAEYALGYCALCGAGLATDSAKAIVYLQEASRLDIADASLELGKCYISGKGVGVDLGQAVSYLKLASYQANAQACELLDLIGAGGITGINLAPPRPPRIMRNQLPFL